MKRGMEHITSVRVRDVMQTDVITIFENATMADAAAVLATNEVSGAPVIDVAGKCVGMLSVFDFARRENEATASSETLAGGLKHSVVSEPSQPVHIEGIREDRVGEHMSSSVQTIEADALLIDAARVFLGAHVHHLVAIDECGRPAGILTTMDVVACIVELADSATDEP